MDTAGEARVSVTIIIGVLVPVLIIIIIFFGYLSYRKWFKNIPNQIANDPTPNQEIPTPRSGQQKKLGSNDFRPSTYIDDSNT